MPEVALQPAAQPMPGCQADDEYESILQAVTTLAPEHVVERRGDSVYPVAVGTGRTFF